MVRILIIPAILFASTAGALEGTVRYEDGSPVPGAVVYALQERPALRVRNNSVMAAEDLARGISDRQGQFKIDLPAGGIVGLFARDLEDACAYLPCVQPTDGVVLTIADSARLSATILKGEEPVAGEKVYVAPVKRMPGLVYVHMATTNKAGRISVSNLMPGSYCVQTAHEVPQVGCCFKSVVTRQKRVNLGPGMKLEARLGGTGLPRVTGRVTDAEGVPLHGVWVRLLTSQAAPASGIVWSDVTTRDGRYGLYDVPPGSYEMVCFRRLGENSYSHTLEDRKKITVPASQAKGAEQVVDVAIDLAPFKPLGIGQQAPDIKLSLLDGTEFNLNAERGKVVVVHFYAGWCRPCVASMGYFDDLAEAFPAGKLRVVGISLDESLEDAKAFVAEKGVHHPVAYGGTWAECALRKDYRVVNIPTSFIIDADGKIAQLDLFGGVLKKFVGDLLEK